MKKNKHEKYIESHKFLRDKKYYKNNIWQFAHHESSAARGFAGGCSCCPAKHYNAHLRNKRNSKGKKSWNDGVTGNLCLECVGKIEEIIGCEFKEKHCG